MGVRAWAVMWVAFWWLWLLLVGQWNREQWIAGAIAATVAATVGEAARARARVRLGLPSLAALWKVPYAVVSDFAVVMWALAARKEGTMRERPRAGAWPAFVAGLSPNAYVVDMDDERVLLHDLVPRRASEEPL